MTSVEDPSLEDVAAELPPASEQDEDPDRDDGTDCTCEGGIVRL